MAFRRRSTLLIATSLVSVAIALALVLSQLPSAPVPAVEAPAPDVTVLANPWSGIVPLDVVFEARVVGGVSPLTFAWAFGDGDSDSGAIARHTYQAVGTYTATVAVADQRGRTDSDDIVIVARAPPAPPPACKTSSPGSGALCFEATVSQVIDGDTIDTDDGTTTRRIRLVLVDAPELSETGGLESKAYLTDLCLGTTARIDEDDWQVGDDPFGRILAVVRCGDVHANAALLSSGHAVTYYAYCSASEFGSEDWTGCAYPPPPPPSNCDPSYPDVCIPPPPPDLDCDQVLYTNFRVLPPDPHYFDGDRDGIGCET